MAKMNSKIDNMTIAIVSDMLNLHQSFLCDAFYEKCEGQFTFFEVNRPTSDDHIKLSSSVDLHKKPYYYPTWKSKADFNKALEICKNVDALIVCTGSCFAPFVRERLKMKKITFEYSERQLKRGLINCFSRTSLSSYKLYSGVDHENLYKLCSSAYTANDMYLLHPFFKNKCYKWGYFTYVPELDMEQILKARRRHEKIRLLSVARFINWKRVNMSIILARALKDLGVSFEYNIIGDGPLFDKIKLFARKIAVDDCVTFLRKIDNKDVQKIMMDTDIFVFTSNKREGWGAVLNEAMGNGCACVASDLIGSVPYLIKSDKNGFSFAANSTKDMIDKVLQLILNQNLREKFSINAYETMRKNWTPENAVNNFCRLVMGINSGNYNPVDDGPCSKAYPIKNRKFQL